VANRRPKKGKSCSAGQKSLRALHIQLTGPYILAARTGTTTLKIQQNTANKTDFWRKMVFECWRIGMPWRWKRNYGMLKIFKFKFDVRNVFGAPLWFALL